MKQAGVFLSGPGPFLSFVLQGLIGRVLFPSASSSSFFLVVFVFLF
jgi:hypothetical protein